MATNGTGNVGQITQVIGPVLDVEFESGDLPQIFNARRYELDMAPYPTLGRVFDNAMKLDAFERARPEKQPDASK